MPFPRLPAEVHFSIPTSFRVQLLTMVPLSVPTPTSLIPSTQTLTLAPHPPRLYPWKPHITPIGLSSSPPSPIPPLSPLRRPFHPLSAAGPSASLLPFDDLVEKDWSFLDSAGSDPDWARKAGRIISAAEIGRGSRVLVSMGTVGFVDRVADSCPCELLVAIHDSLFVLAMVKEKHDGIRCWQGEISVVPEKFLPFDVVFVCYFPGMGISLDHLLSSIAQRCSPGARLVISFDQGRETIEKEHRQKYPDMVTSDLPGREALENAAKGHWFQLTEFVDEPTFYLAVLKLCESIK